MAVKEFKVKNYNNCYDISQLIRRRCGEPRLRFQTGDGYDNFLYDVNDVSVIARKRERIGDVLYEEMFIIGNEDNIEDTRKQLEMMLFVELTHPDNNITERIKRAVVAQGVN